MKNNIAAALLALTCAASANAQHRGGFYAGAGIGLNMLKGEIKTSNPSVGSTRDKKFTPKKNGFIGELIAGYDHPFGNGFNLNAEVFLSIASASQNFKREFDNATESESSFKQKFGIGGRIRPGYNVTKDGQIFLTVGFDLGRFEYNRKLDKDNRVSKKGFVFGGLIGCGYKHQINNNLAVTLEYNYIQYGKTTARNGSGNDSKISDSYKPKNHRFMLGMRYYF